MLSYLLAARQSGKIAAIAPISAEFRDASKPTRFVPVLAINGNADRVVAYDNSRKVVWDWGSFYGCPSAPISQENNFVLQETFCQASLTKEISLYTIKGGGHEWFQMIKSADGQDITAINLIWSFFAAHPLS